MAVGSSQDVGGAARAADGEGLLLDAERMLLGDLGVAAARRLGLRLRRLRLLLAAGRVRVAGHGTAATRRGGLLLLQRRLLLASGQLRVDGRSAARAQRGGLLPQRWLLIPGATAPGTRGGDGGSTRGRLLLDLLRELGELAKRKTHVRLQRFHALHQLSGHNHTCLEVLHALHNAPHDCLHCPQLVRPGTRCVSAHGPGGGCGHWG
mmetsp:Transcript_61764/g.171192  ORF Transcript_61764/g.171192 Transcript_61764/m.171192 type:complete len:207 (-) Transcript_61764:32-652(-)